MLKNEIAGLIVNKLTGNLDQLQTAWKNSTPVAHVVVEELLPTKLALEIANGFPQLTEMKHANTMRERKYTSAVSSKWGEATQSAFLALQDQSVLDALSQLTGILKLNGDPAAYAGGISAMEFGDFLNPHLDNSTHPSIQGYRRLNSLYYIGENWNLESGGNLELWSPRM